MKSLINSIIFEGITGSGKSTQIDNILSSEYGPRYVVFNNTSPIYNHTKDARASMRNANNPVIPEALMHLFTNWMKLYEKEPYGKLAIIDRFALSNLVYFVARCEIEEIPIDIHKARDMFLMPFGLSVLAQTHTAYLDCDPMIAQQRTLSRNNRPYFDLELQKMARDRYLSELNNYSYPITMIDSSGDAEITYGQIQQMLERVVED